MVRIPTCAVLLAALAVPQDPGKDLRSKTVETRLTAIEVLAKSDRPDAERLITSVLVDRDWEVQERAAIALGTRKSASAVKALVDLALDGEVARVRRAAAEALLAIDQEQGAPALLRKAKPRTQVAALEALAIVARGRSGLVEADRLQKLVHAEDPATREAAAAAWLECATDRAATLKTLLAEPSLVLRCRALDAVRVAPRQEDGEPLLELLAGPPQNDVVERRALAAARAWVASTPAEAASRARAVLTRLASPAVALARRARLAALFASGESPPLERKVAVELLAPCLDASDARPRAAAAKALRDIGGDDALAAALSRFTKENIGHARMQLLESVVALRGVDAPDEAAWVAEALAKDHDPSVRERAAVRLGRPKTPGAVSALTGAARDPDWFVACAAFVSLGKSGHDDALAPLLEGLRHERWTHRGAAVVGLMHMNRAAVVEPLIGMLGDGTAVVQRSALAALHEIAGQTEIGPDAKAWRAWWEANGSKHLFRDRRESIERQKKYGYEVPDSEIYRGLDVVVFTSRGDHIEHLLERLTIAHRTTEANLVSTAGLHPEAIFVANCTGEIEENDVEPLTWFVRTGGYLFGSCWALSQTIEKLHPSVVRKFETPAGEVLDDVRAASCRPDSGFLRGVFQDGVVPIYHLEGAHLIEVLDPEVAEVLVDSPDAAERHGSGNLAAWFESGHGVILDSVNHFDLQGLEVAQGLKNERERQAYAIDHMGLDYATWRASQKEGYWQTSPRAARNVPDLSAFRFVTNFVRSKRIGER